MRTVLAILAMLTASLAIAPAVHPVSAVLVALPCVSALDAIRAICIALFVAMPVMWPATLDCMLLIWLVVVRFVLLDSELAVRCIEPNSEARLDRIADMLD